MILQMLYINESCFTCTSIWPSLFLLPFLPLPITFFHTLAHLLDLGMNLPPNLQQVTTNTTFKKSIWKPVFCSKNVFFLTHCRPFFCIPPTPGVSFRQTWHVMNGQYYHQAFPLINTPQRNFVLSCAMTRKNHMKCVQNYWLIDVMLHGV